MAGNGDAQRLETLEKAITGEQYPVLSDDMVARVDQVVNHCRAIAHQGKVMEEMSSIFAAHLEKLLGEYHGRMLERLAEMEQMMGKLGKRTTPSL